MYSFANIWTKWMQAKMELISVGDVKKTRTMTPRLNLGVDVQLHKGG